MIKKCMMFYTPACSKCPKIKEYLEDKEIEKELIDASTEEGLEKARELKVSNVPVVVFFDENGKEISRAVDIEEVKKVIEHRSLSDV